MDKLAPPTELEPVSRDEIFRGVDLWNPEGVTENLDVRIRDGIVVSIAPSERPTDAARMCLMPSGVDTQAILSRVLPQINVAGLSSSGTAARMRMYPQSKVCSALRHRD